MLTRRHVLAQGVGAASLLAFAHHRPPPVWHSLGPWDGSQEEGWRPPPATLGCLDFRAPEDGHGCGYFVTRTRPDSAYAVLGQGDSHDVPATVRLRTLFATWMGFHPRGRTLAALVWDCLTRGGDPTGQDRWKPLMPTHVGALECWLGGPHALCTEPFQWGRHPHTQHVQATLHQDLLTLLPTLPQRQARQVVGSLLMQYDLPASDWRVLVPRPLWTLIHSPLAPATQIDDTFNRADSSTLGTSSDSQFTWTEFTGTNGGNPEIASNAARCVPDVVQSPSNGWARAEFDFATANQQVSCVPGFNLGTLNGNGVGVLARYSATANVYYRYRVTTGDGTYQLAKVLGSINGIALATVSNINTVSSMALMVSGSSLYGFRNGVIHLRATDTEISSGLRTGLWVGQDAAIATSVLDDFQAKGLGVNQNRGRFFFSE